MIGVFTCPECSAEQPFAGLCRDCSKKSRAARAAESKGPSKPGLKPSNRLKRRARVKARSDKELLRSAALAAIKTILKPFVTHCLRCNRPGSGFKSKKNPDGFEAHHWARRRGYFYFVVIPLCPDCHEEVEQDGNQARADRWLIKSPIQK